jgi:hypothetical protein
MTNRLEELCHILVSGSDEEKEEAAIEILKVTAGVSYRIVEGELE